mgnify:FL=1|tara:strand:- start:110 stop:310 length:201 start_codon:yes stop_codon:yes gene_type:complete
MSKTVKKIFRSPKKGKIAGVCFALGEQYNTDPILIRIIFLVLLLSGPGLLLYIISWMIIPTKENLQ